MIEVLVELLFEIFGEVLLQILLQALVEMGLHMFASKLRKPNPWLAAVGYAMLGGLVGIISLWLHPQHYTPAGWLRVLNLVATPILAGLVMMALGWWRRRRGDTAIGLDRFWYGYLFALAVGVVRFHLAD